MGIWLCGAEIRSGTVPGAEHDLLSLRAKSNFSFGLIFIFYMQPSGSGVNQVDVQAAVLDLGINALCVFPQLYLAFCFFTPFKAKEA